MKQVTLTEKDICNDAMYMFDDLIHAMYKKNEFQFAFYGGQYVQMRTLLEEMYSPGAVIEVQKQRIREYNKLHHTQITWEQFKEYWTDVIIVKC